MSLLLRLEQSFNTSHVKLNNAIYDVVRNLLIEDFGVVKCLDPITLIKVDGGVYVPFSLDNPSHIMSLIKAMGYDMTIGHGGIITVKLKTHETFRNSYKAALCLCLGMWYVDNFERLVL